MIYASFEDRLAACTRHDGDCLVWTRYLVRGYGHVKPKVMGETQAHRMVWVYHNGHIPDGLCVCHSCDNRACVNIEHLWLGTLSDNTQDMLKKGRNKPTVGERNAQSRLTEDNVREIHARVVAGEHVGVLAREFYVSHATIAGLLVGRTWRHLGLPRVPWNRQSRLLPEDVLEIRRRAANGERGAIIGMDYGLSRQAVRCIVARRTWAKLEAAA